MREVYDAIAYTSLEIARPHMVESSARTEENNTAHKNDLSFPFHPNRPGLCWERNTSCKFAPAASPVTKHTRDSRIPWQIAGRVT